MHIVLKCDCYGMEEGERVEEAFGPFDTRADAEAFVDRVEKANLVGTLYHIMDVAAPQKLVDWINQLGMGKV